MDKDRLNNMVVDLFHGISYEEEKAVITDEFKDISNKDLHIIDAIGIKKPKNMSTIARDLNITVGTLTTAINNLLKKGYVNMKKSLIVIAALILAMSVAGCGKKTENTNTTPQQTAQADASGAYENGSATETLDGQDYSKNVDMAAVEGTEAKSDTKADSYSGEVSNNDISIEEAKLINYDDSDVVVVSFEFTNKTDSDQSFSGVYDVIAEQNGSSLAPATVIGVDGVELLTLSQNIAPGETITVQKAYKLDSKSSPLEITVQPFSSDDESFVTKTFNF